MTMVIYPGPSVEGWAREEATIHPEAGLMSVGSNEITDEALLSRLLSSGLVASALDEPDPGGPPSVWPPRPGQTDESEAEQAEESEAEQAPAEETPPAPRKGKK